jgi:hypothetical protein
VHGFAQFFDCETAVDRLKSAERVPEWRLLT